MHSTVPASGHSTVPASGLFPARWAEGSGWLVATLIAEPGGVTENRDHFEVFHVHFGLMPSHRRICAKWWTSSRGTTSRSSTPSPICATVDSCPRQRTPANPVVSEADSGIPAVRVDRGDIQHSGSATSRPLSRCRRPLARWPRLGPERQKRRPGGPCALPRRPGSRGRRRER